MSVCDECPISLKTNPVRHWHCLVTGQSMFEGISFCLHAAALRAVLDDPTLVLVAVEKTCHNCAWINPCHTAEDTWFGNSPCPLDRVAEPDKRYCDKWEAR